jgi:hypothetical protein
MELQESPHIPIRGAMGMIRSIIIAVFITLASTVVCFSADDTIGLVTEVKGQAFVVRNGQQHVPEAGFKLKINDTLSTGPDAAIGVIFNDETVLSIGANSELAVNEYVFNPDQSRFSFVVKMVRGTAAYMSGLIAKISPESARFITPSASIGIRGTKMVIQVENDKGIL